jgi:hypothetical protein
MQTGIYVPAQQASFVQTPVKVAGMGCFVSWRMHRLFGIAWLGDTVKQALQNRYRMMTRET